MPASEKGLSIPGEFAYDGKEITVGFTSPSRETILAIDGNKPFPAGNIDLGGLSASVPSSKRVQLGDRTRNVAFEFDASALYYLQVISQPAAVLKALGSVPGIEPGIDLADGATAADRFMLLKLKYDLGATAKGAAGLGTGLSVNFGASGQTNGSWDVVHRFRDEDALDVLKATFDALRLPRQINHPDQLAPGTWLVAEIDGSVDLNLGVEAGYDFSWLRQLTGGSLSGDLGVKVALAAKATLGFSANGKYMLALSHRDTSRKLRLELYKLAKKGWNFALNASVGVQGNLPPGLASSDPADLIRAIFGVQANQLIRDLRDVKKVAAGGSLTDQAANYLVELGRKTLGGAADDSKAFNGGVASAEKLVKQLSHLGERTTSQIFSLLMPGHDADVNANALVKLEGVLTDIEKVADNPKAILPIIENQLQQVAFFDSQFGKWLTSLMQQQGVASPLSVLADTGDADALRKKIGDAARTTLDLLNGEALRTLAEFATDRLNLENIASPGGIDRWLKTKIANFLGKAMDSVTQDDLKEVQKTANALFQKADAFYSEAIKAAQKQYEATLSATYERTTTDTALIDVLFDFDTNPGLGPLLQDAIDGDFKEILTNPRIPGVTLNSGVLTHGFHRQTRVELTLPFVDLRRASVTDALAKMEVKHDGGGRVLAYSAKASNDTTAFAEGRSVRDGQMTLVMHLDALPDGIQKGQNFQASFGYSLRSAYEDISTRQLVDLLNPLITNYSLPLMPSGVESWVNDLAGVTKPSSPGRIGPARVSLDVAVAPCLPKVWLNARADRKDKAYFVLSKKIQQRLRSLISSVYFSDAHRYQNPDAAYPLIVYSCLAPMNSFSINEDAIPKITPEANGEIYWDWRDERHLIALMYDATTRQAILAFMSSINQILVGLGSRWAQDYTPKNLGGVYAAASKKAAGESLPTILSGLLSFEASFVTDVIKAATLPWPRLPLILTQSKPCRR